MRCRRVVGMVKESTGRCAARMLLCRMDGEPPTSSESGLVDLDSIPQPAVRMVFPSIVVPVVPPRRSRLMETAESSGPVFIWLSAIRRVRVLGASPSISTTPWLCALISL